MYAFGPFCLDPAERLLLRDGQPVPLEPKVFDTLVLLIKNSGHLMEKSELISKMWPDAVVEEGSLTRNISTLRRILGDGENGFRFIETVPRRGYRFVASVTESSADTRDVSSEKQGGAPVVDRVEQISSLDDIELPHSNGNRIVERRKQQAGQNTDKRATLDEKTLPSTEASRFGFLKRHKTAAVVAIIGLACAVAIFTYKYFTRVDSAAIHSVAVLPFANLSNDPNIEYIADGMAENLINNLTELPQLKVIARSSAFKYKGKQVDPEEVARALGVAAVVTGRIIQRGENLEISVELTNTTDGTQMWGRQYNQRVSELQTVQTEISREIAEKLRLRLTGAQERKLARQATPNQQAYQLYLAGLLQSRRGNLESDKKALEYFNQAVVLDPEFALAFASMTAVYSNLADAGALDPKEAIEKGKTAAQKALELDGTLAEAHNVMGVIKRQEWDWSGAESEFKRAIEINPNLSAARGNYAFLLAVMGRTGEALKENRQAQELDPLRLSFKGTEAVILFVAGLHDEALRVCQNMIRMQPEYPTAHHILGGIYAAKGMYPEALNEVHTTIKLTGGAPNGLIDLGNTYTMMGRRDETLAILNKLKTRKEYVSPFGLAILYAGLGDKENAFECLERAYAAHDSQLQYLKADTRLRSLRSDPRFTELLRRMKLV